MARIGYARAGTLDQDLDTQLARLTAEGCGIVRAEKISGGSREGRPELATVLAFLRPGDELVVTRLDRLGRDTRDVFDLIHEDEQRGASVTVLDPRPAGYGPGQMRGYGMVAAMDSRQVRSGTVTGPVARRRMRPDAVAGVLPQADHDLGLP